MRNDREYQICKDIAIYLRYQYPDVLFRFDMAGLNLSKAQAGRNKAIQVGLKWPDLFIAEPSRDGRYKGLFIEIKTEGTKLYLCSNNSKYATDHILAQALCLDSLGNRGYRAHFSCGFDAVKQSIDNYLKS